MDDVPVPGEDDGGLLLAGHNFLCLMVVSQQVSQVHMRETEALRRARRLTERLHVPKLPLPRWDVLWQPIVSNPLNTTRLQLGTVTCPPRYPAGLGLGIRVRDSFVACFDGRQC